MEGKTKGSAVRSPTAIRVLNFSHPLTVAQVEAVEALAQVTVADVVSVPTHFDLEQPFAEQIVAAVDAAGLTPIEWQATPVAIVAPALAAIASLMIAEIHGRAGYFVPVIRLRPRAGAMPPAFEVAEILDLQAQRDTARTRR